MTIEPLEARVSPAALNPARHPAYYIYGANLKKLTVGKATYVQSQISGLTFNSIGKATATSFA